MINHTLYDVISTAYGINFDLNLIKHFGISDSTARRYLARSYDSIDDIFDIFDEKSENLSEEERGIYHILSRMLRSIYSGSLTPQEATRESLKFWEIDNPPLCFINLLNYTNLSFYLKEDSVDQLFRTKLTSIFPFNIFDQNVLISLADNPSETQLAQYAVESLISLGVAIKIDCNRREAVKPTILEDALKKTFEEGIHPVRQFFNKLHKVAGFKSKEKLYEYLAAYLDKNVETVDRSFKRWQKNTNVSLENITDILYAISNGNLETMIYLQGIYLLLWIVLIVADISQNHPSSGMYKLEEIIDLVKKWERALSEDWPIDPL